MLKCVPGVMVVAVFRVCSLIPLDSISKNNQMMNVILALRYALQLLLNLNMITDSGFLFFPSGNLSSSYIFLLKMGHSVNEKSTLSVLSLM